LFQILTPGFFLFVVKPPPLTIDWSRPSCGSGRIQWKVPFSWQAFFFTSFPGFSALRVALVLFFFPPQPPRRSFFLDRRFPFNGGSSPLWSIFLLQEGFYIQRPSGSSPLRGFSLGRCDLFSFPVCCCFSPSVFSFSHLSRSPR